MRRFLKGMMKSFCRLTGGDYRSYWDLAIERELRGEYPMFPYDGRLLPQALFPVNCGWHPAEANERTVELAIADDWLSRRPSSLVIEIGAVTPYYWPGRIPRIVDPTDPHPLVTDRTGLEAIDFHGRDVLCISTLEHVGSSEYGLPPSPGAFSAATEKIFREPRAVLATIPIGYNPIADDFVFSGPPPGVRVSYLVRTNAQTPPYWIEASAADARKPYARWKAGAVAILVKSGEGERQ